MPRARRAPLPRPTEVHGVDWSGARDAGRHAWWAAGRRRGPTLHLESLERGDRLPGSGPDRATFLAALLARIERLGHAAIGFDFPFGLPASMVEDGDWRTFAIKFGARFDSPEAFRTWCRRRSGGREIKRATDVLARTPFAPWNLRLYRQTYWGIAGVLAPLIERGRAVAPPMQRARAGLPWLLEACPASMLKRLGLYRSYKGASPALREAREALVESLVARGMLDAPTDLIGIMLEDRGGDALDATLAACASARALADPRFPRCSPWHPAYRLEAVVWF